MESQVFDVVKSEKEKAIARFNRFRRVAKLRQIFELVVVLGLLSWSTARAPAVMETTVDYFVQVSAFLFNHHVVFLVGNVIIVLLFVLCRQNDGGSFSTAGDFYDDYIKHSLAVHQRDPTLPPSPCPIPDRVDVAADEEKQIVVCPEFEKSIPIPQCDDVSEAIAKATKQIRKFQRTQSEKPRSWSAVMVPTELRRSESQNRRGAPVSTDRLERLSSEEFRRTIDAFIDTHWCKKNLKKNQNQFEQQYERRRLLKMG